MRAYIRGVRTDTPVLGPGLTTPISTLLPMFSPQGVGSPALASSGALPTTSSSAERLIPS